MHTLATAYYSMRDALLNLYDDRESTAIAHEVLEYLTGMTKTERLINKERYLSKEQQNKYEDILITLTNSVPLQYALGEAWFMGERYVVNNSVLIPRPETEELVAWIGEECSAAKETLSVMEVGTGSGCISISIYKMLGNVIIESCDVSSDALDVAATNADNLGAVIEFKKVNFLNWDEYNWKEKYDVIVSNPPYIPLSVKDKLHSNVVNNEPHVALFVPNDDPLVFYKAIAAFGKQHLGENGRIYCELDTDNAMRTKFMFEKEGYKNVEIKHDMNGNMRMIRAMK